jgi:hypothetical protein
MNPTDNPVFVLQQMPWRVVGLLAILAATAALVLGVVFNLTEEHRLQAVARVLAAQLRHPGDTDQGIRVWRLCEHWRCGLGLAPSQELGVVIGRVVPEPRLDALTWYEAELAQLGWDVAPVQRPHVGSATRFGCRVDMSLPKWGPADLAVVVSECRLRINFAALDSKNLRLASQGRPRKGT